MMNIIQIEDALKSFSQDQLIGELNQPSGSVPEFLVLTELGRRNRIKSDMDRQQAENQPTVAEEVVNAAGVPQGGIRDIARSMDAKSSIEQNTGVAKMQEGGRVEEPKNRFDMLMAYLRSLGADDEEIEQATGKSIAEIINFGGDYDTDKKSDGGVVKMARAGSPTREVVYQGKRYLTDGSGRVFESSRAGSMRRGREVKDSDIISGVLGTGPNVQSDVGGIASISRNIDSFNPIESDGITPVQKPDDIFTEGMFVGPDSKESKPSVGTEEFNRKDIPPNLLSGMPTRNETLLQDLINQNKTLVPGANVPRQQTFSDNQPQEQEELIKEVKDDPNYNFSNDPTKGISDPGGGLESYFGTTESIKEDPLNAKNVIKAATQSSSGDEFNDVISSLARSKAELEGGIPSDELSIEPFNNQLAASPSTSSPFLPSGSGDIPDELMTQFNNTPSKGKGGDGGGDGDDDDKGSGTKGGSAIGSLESEIANMLKQNEKDKEQDKWLSLARAGLALMGSNNPTLGGAIGEAGMVGLESFQDARRSYRDDKITLLDAQRKLEQARATAASKDKSGLTGTNVISRLNNIQTRKNDLQKKIAELSTPSVETAALDDEGKAKLEQSIETLRREIAKLSVEEEFFQSMIGGVSAGSSVNFDATK